MDCERHSDIMNVSNGENMKKVYHKAGSAGHINIPSRCF
jgi:hypothetical protein